MPTAVGVEHAAFSIVALTLMLALTRRRKWLRRFLEIAVIVATLLVFLILQQGGDLRAVGAMFSPLLGILIMLFGLYLMISWSRKPSEGLVTVETISGAPESA
jgi:peptidoglycan/LPS O-acetylase OafA/YrhL